MSAVHVASWVRGPAGDWLIVVAGLLLLYVPTGVRLATELWHREEFAHGPVILAVVLWLIWERREALRVSAEAVSRALQAKGFIKIVHSKSRSIEIMNVKRLSELRNKVVEAARLWNVERTAAALRDLNRLVCDYESALKLP